MRDRKLATRYAKALLGALLEATDQNLADELLAALAESMKTNAEFRGFLIDPANSKTAKTSVLDQLATARSAPARLKTFLGMLVENSRLTELPSIAEVFHLEREAGQRAVSATLTSAGPLSPELQARAVEALRRLSGRKVNLTVAVDPRLIGGAVAQVGSMVYDGSLKTQLDRLRRTMGEG